MSRSIDRAQALPKLSTLALLALLSALSACDRPNFEGPQLQDPPQGFALQPGSRASRSMLAHLPEIHHDAWVQTEAPHSTIRINGYPGRLVLFDVMDAQDSARAHATDPNIRFSQIEPLTIDGRDALGWEERIDDPARSIPWVAYRVMVPYDTISYTIEFVTEDPAFTAGAPGSMLNVVSTFAIGETTYNWPLIVLALGVFAFVAYKLRERSRAEAMRRRSLTLVTVKVDDDAEEQELVTVGDPPAGEGQGRGT